METTNSWQGTYKMTGGARTKVLCVNHVEGETFLIVKNLNTGAVRGIPERIFKENIDHEMTAEEVEKEEKEGCGCKGCKDEKTSDQAEREEALRVEAALAQDVVKMVERTREQRTKFEAFQCSFCAGKFPMVQLAFFGINNSMPEGKNERAICHDCHIHMQMFMMQAISERVESMGQPASLGEMIVRMLQKS